MCIRLVDEPEKSMGLNFFREAVRQSSSKTGVFKVDAQTFDVHILQTSSAKKANLSILSSAFSDIRFHTFR